MENKDRSVSPHFKLSEFNKRRGDSRWVEPHPVLIHVIQKIRERTGAPVVITDGARSVEEHIEQYISLYGEGWLDKITWRSRHLASFDSPYLMAADIKCRSGSQWLSGDQINTLIQGVVQAPSFKDLHGHCYFGVGIGSTYVHIDTGNRDHNATWRYGY